MKAIYPAIDDAYFRMRIQKVTGSPERTSCENVIRIQDDGICIGRPADSFIVGVDVALVDTMNTEFDARISGIGTSNLYGVIGRGII
jgi:hypothetical protein